MNNSGAADLSNPRPEPVPEEVPQTVGFRTAFVVFQELNGNWAASPSPELLADNVEISSIATADEIAGACGVIQSDVTAQKAAGMVHSLLAAMGKQAQAMAKQAEEARINAEIARKAGLK